MGGAEQQEKRSPELTWAKIVLVSPVPDSLSNMEAVLVAMEQCDGRSMGRWEGGRGWR